VRSCAYFKYSQEKHLIRYNIHSCSEAKLQQDKKELDKEEKISKLIRLAPKNLPGNLSV
jgi:hypothetical protein